MPKRESQDPTSPVATADRTIREPEWIGLSEVQAMTLAQKLQRGGIFIASKQALIDPEGADRGGDRERTQELANRDG